MLSNTEKTYPYKHGKDRKNDLFDYTEDSIKSLDRREHIRLRPRYVHR